jgi:hypothetical protein
LIALYQGDNAPAVAAVNALLDATQAQANGKKNDVVLRVQRLKGEVLLRQGESAQALTLLNETLRDQEALLGGEHADTAFTRVLTALAKLNDSNMAETRDELNPAVAALAKARGEHHPLTLSARAYEALLSPDAPSNAKQKIASRVRSELGWQVGAEKLAALMEGNSFVKAREIPIVF